jgi:hypothetical protein
MNINWSTSVRGEALRPETAFSVLYDGQPVAEGTMDARDLAPSLLALADLVDEAAPLVDPSLPQVSLRVRSDFQKGSFEVLLGLAEQVNSGVLAVFGSPTAQAWSTLLSILGISGLLGLLQLIKKSKGRKPTTVTIERTERVSVTFEGDEPISVDARTWKLFNSGRARRAVERLVSPLLEKGFDVFKVRHKGKETLAVDKSEAPYFVAPPEHEGETISEVNARLVIVAPSFQPGNKWRVNDGARSLHVLIEDPAFERAVQQGAEAFRKGDRLHVTLRTRQWMEDGILRAEYSIVKVHRHEPGPQQTKIDYESDAGD